LKVHEDATTRDVIRQAVAKAGANSRNDHDYVLLEEVNKTDQNPLLIIQVFLQFFNVIFYFV
jgi:hypothetical protein